MKIRQGFVSNSSSSCFVVALSKVPKTKEELQKLFFGEEETYPHPYPEHSSLPKAYACEEIAKVLWNDLKSPMTPSGVREAMASGYIEGSPEIDWNFPEKDREAYWDKLRAAQNEHAHKQADKFMAVHPDCVFLEFEYGDDTHIGCAMEHGTLFDKVPYFRVSHH